MNIEEAKRKLHNMAYRDLQTKPYDLKLADVMQILNQIELNQPKPVVPKFVAEWIETCDMRFANLNCVFGENCPEKVKEWVSIYGNHEKMLQALLCGYTVKKEKKYKVRDKRLSPNQNYLNFDKNSECWFFNGIGTLSLNASHTRKALEESGFNVFDDDNYEVIEVTE
ncbi:TPA: DUF1642 domain-containing protein [Streptococcus pyogenes]|nr:DUF1642 domain-containing protein [Streptococcus pyogenes]HER0890526.1 DUF1642 domain-containing protein [Streptococcus pyogenes]HER0893895.1 DUF1642 domain-containing protein [Streptococcus pyogenes]